MKDRVLHVWLLAMIFTVTMSSTLALHRSRSIEYYRGVEPLSEIVTRHTPPQDEGANTFADVMRQHTKKITELARTQAKTSVVAAIPTEESEKLFPVNVSPCSEGEIPVISNAHVAGCTSAREKVARPQEPEVFVAPEPAPTPPPAEPEKESIEISSIQLGPSTQLKRLGNHPEAIHDAVVLSADQFQQ